MFFHQRRALREQRRGVRRGKINALSRQGGALPGEGEVVLVTFLVENKIVLELKSVEQLLY